MPNWLTKIFTGGVGELVAKVGGVANRFAEGHLGKKELVLEIEKIANSQFLEVESTVRAELSAKERIIVAELSQGDNYTKRARPTIIYAGLGIMLLDMVFRYAAHFTGNPIPATQIPTEFWWAWGGVTGTYAVGRSAEKRGVSNGLTQVATGNKFKSKILEEAA